MYTDAMLVQFFAFLEASKYVLLWIGCYFEGTLVMITGGILARLGEVDFLVAYLVLLSADFAADITWYAIGYFGARRFIMRWGYLVGVTPESVAKAERRFKHYDATIIIASKLTMGFGLAIVTLITAGMLRLQLRRFATINFVGNMIWVAILMTLGYFYGELLLTLPTNVGITLTALALLIGFFVVRFVANAMSKSDW